MDISCFYLLNLTSSSGFFPPRECWAVSSQWVGPAHICRGRLWCPDPELAALGPHCGKLLRTLALVEAFLAPFREGEWVRQWYILNISQQRAGLGLGDAVGRKGRSVGNWEGPFQLSIFWIPWAPYSAACPSISWLASPQPGDGSYYSQSDSFFH